MRESISLLFGLVSLFIKALANVVKAGEVMSKELEVSAKSFAAEQRLTREISIVKERAKLEKELAKHGLKLDDVAKKAKQRRESDEDEAANL